MYLLCAVFAYMYLGGSLELSFEAGVVIRRSAFYAWHAAGRCATATPYKRHYYCCILVRIGVSRQTDNFGQYDDKICFHGSYKPKEPACGEWLLEGKLYHVRTWGKQPYPRTTPTSTVDPRLAGQSNTEACYFIPGHQGHDLW